MTKKKALTAVALAAYVGRRASYQVTKPATLRIEVDTTDARQIFGRVEIQIEPTHGAGKAWADLTSLTFHDNAKP